MILSTLPEVNGSRCEFVIYFRPINQATSAVTSCTSTVFHTMRQQSPHHRGHRVSAPQFVQ